MGIPDHLTCLLRNLYAGQEAAVRIGHGTTDWFQIRKRICQGCVFSPCLFNFYAEYIRQNASLDEAQAGIKIAERNINNLRYEDNTTPEAEREELKRWGKIETVTDFIFSDFKIAVDREYSHEIERYLLRRKAMTNLDSVLKSRDITLLTKVCIVKAMIFPVVMYDDT